MRTVLHLLPHRGGGAETYIDALEGIEGFEHRRIALSASRSPLVAPLSIAGRTPGLLRASNDADLLHVHGDVAVLLSWPLLGRRPSLWTPQGLHLLRRSAGARRAAVERALEHVLAHASAVLCSSEDERGELSFLPEPTRARLQVIPNGVEAPAGPSERGAVRRELRLDESTLAVLYLGQLEERKDPETAARAVLEARERGADAVLLVAGSGPLEDRLRPYAGPAVRLLGFREDAGRLYDAADAFVLPSSREGQSFALLEAMSHGLPLLVADGSGNAETVGPAGVVFPFGDDVALAGELGALAGDPALRERLGKAARERARSSFGLDEFRERVAEAYGAALTEPGRDGDAAPA
jgi:glycosyltransferase involved in cell wall biosynthesis